MKFIEKGHRRLLNARIARRTKVEPAQLSDGRSGVVMKFDGLIVVMSNDEAVQLANRIADVVEGVNAD